MRLSSDGRLTWSVAEDPVRGPKPGDVVPARPRVLGGRAGIVVESPESVDRAGRAVHAIDEVAACNRGLYREDVVERARVRVEERVGEAMRRSGLLVGQRHQAREDRACQARAT